MKGMFSFGKTRKDGGEGDERGGKGKKKETL